MIRVVICDDKSEQLAKIQSSCIQYFEKHPDQTVQILAYQSPMLCLEELEKMAGAILPCWIFACRESPASR